MRTILIIFIASFNLAFTQSFSVFDIDTTNFPLMKAKFFAIDTNNEQITNLSATDFELYENGQIRTVTDIECQFPEPPIALSCVLTFDISESMKGEGLKIAKEAASVWINALPLGVSECAITSFNQYNHLNIDFTTDRESLLNALNSLEPYGGTDYEMGLLNDPAGSLQILNSVSREKIVVFLTDGTPDKEPDVQKIVNEANTQNCRIYTVVIGMESPQNLIDISELTGAKHFSNIQSLEEVSEIYIKILQEAQGGKPCTIEWFSAPSCSKSKTELSITLLQNNHTVISEYQSAIRKTASINFETKSINFGPVRPSTFIDSIITVSAINSDFDISDITCSNTAFTASPKSFALLEGESKDITIIFTPIDSFYTSSEIYFENNICQQKIYVSGGYPGKKPKTPTLMLDFPNGGEYIIANSDTLISWSGIPESDNISIEFSSDNGANWFKMEDAASALQYNWSNTPTQISNQCLIKIHQLGNGQEIDSIITLQWNYNYGGSLPDEANSIIQTIDGGFIAAGFTWSEDHDISNIYGGYDYWIVKLNALGKIEWERSLGGSSNDEAFQIIQTVDGGYAVCGFTFSDDNHIEKHYGSADFWITKLDDLGNIEWSTTVGKHLDDFAYSISQTFDKGYVVAGTSKINDFDVLVVRLDSSGNILWRRWYGGTRQDEAISIVQTADSGFVFAGTTYSFDGDVFGNHGSADVWVVKIDTIGDIVWQRCHGGSSLDRPTKFIPTNDDGFILSGQSYSNNYTVTNNYGESDMWVLKMDSLGLREWDMNYGGTDFDKATSIQQTNDNGYIVSGITTSNDIDITTQGYGGFDFLFLKLNEDGTIDWLQTAGGSNDDISTSILETPESEYIIAGYSDSDDQLFANNYGKTDFRICKLVTTDNIIQTDISDSVFSIVAPDYLINDINFHETLLGSSKDTVINPIITNQAAYHLTIDSVKIIGSDANAFTFVKDFPITTIQGSNSISSELRFSPFKEDIHKASLLIFSHSDTIYIKLQGEGANPRIQLLTRILDFGNVEMGNEKVYQDTIVLKNISNSIVQIDETMISGPDYNQFLLEELTSPVALNPNDEFHLTALYKPNIAGRSSSQIKINFDAVGSPEFIQLFGKGIGGTVFVADDSAKIGEEINIRLMLEGIRDDGLLSFAPKYSATIKFNRTVLYPLEDFELQTSMDTTKLTVSGDINIGKELVSIPFLVGLGKVEYSNIEVVDIKLLDENDNVVNYSFFQRPGIFKVLDICKDGGTRLFNPNSRTEIESIAPNPATNNLTIEVNLSKAEFTTISLYNSLGVKVKEVYSKCPNISGLHTLRLNTTDLSSGLYFIILSTETQNQFKCINILK